MILAEETGFEPVVPVRVHILSRDAYSTTLALFYTFYNTYSDYDDKLYFFRYNTGTMINYYYRSLRNKNLQQIEKPKKGTWIFAYNINPTEFIELSELGFESSLLEDAYDYFEVPRFEYSKGVNYFFTRVVVDVSKGEPSTAPAMIAISDDYVLTISHNNINAFTEFTEALEYKCITTQKVKFVIALVTNIVAHYDRSIIKLRRSMTKHFNKEDIIDEGDIAELVSLESTLTDYETSLIPMEMAISNMLINGHSLNLHNDDIDLVEHLRHDISQLVQNTRTVLRSIQNIRSAHSTILANELNRTMKTLTATTIILTVPTMMASIFGMNIKMPFLQHSYSLPITLLLVVTLSFFVYLLFRKKGWL